MKCSLVGDRARILAKFLQFLAKIGPDLYIEGVADGLILGTANSSSSGFARVQLWPSFFLNFEVLPEQLEAGDCCRVALKACIPIFRSMKNVETCDIRMNQSAGKLIIQLHCRENTTKTHFVTILQQESLQAPARNANSKINTLTASQKIFSDILSIFNNTEEELTIDATRKRVTVKNYIESIHVNRQQMRTELSLDPAEFDTYIVDTETNLTFCLKEWRAFLVLAESLNSNIAINFETTGLPIEFTIQDLDVFAVTLFLSTLCSDLDNSKNSSCIVVSDSNTSARPLKAATKRTHAENVDEELNVLLKKPKGRTKRVSSQESSKIQFSNPDIEDCSNNESANTLGGSVTDQNNRWTVARNGEPSNHLQVPSGTRVSTLSPRPATQTDMEIIFLKDTEDESDRTLSSIIFPPIDGQPGTMHTIQETPASEEEEEEIPPSPIERQTQQKRKAALTLFRRCYEPSFKISNITGLNRIMAENSSDEEEH